MEPDELTYRSYLLRLWRVEQNGTIVWRCSLEEAKTGHRQSFAHLEALFSYLQAETIERSALPQVAQQKEEK